MEPAALRAEVSSAKCCGYAVCAELAPSVFKLDGDGFAHVDGVIAPEDEAAAQEAAESCPEEAIILLRGSKVLWEPAE